MSKEILYKAKRVDNGEWVCGLPIYKNYIRVFTEHEFETAMRTARMVLSRLASSLKMNKVLNYNWRQFKE